MKRLALLIISTLICGVVFTNCSDKAENKEVTNEISVTLKNTENYSKTLVGGDEEGASIKVQALHYEKSELIRDESTNFCVMYCYKPIADFVGTDCVVIDVTHNKTGFDPEVQTLKINFTITK